MFRPLNFFADVPCPSLRDSGLCSLPHCLFSHQDEVVHPCTARASPTAETKGVLMNFNATTVASMSAQQIQDAAKPGIKPGTGETLLVSLKQPVVPPLSLDGHSAVGETSIAPTTDPRLRQIVEKRLKETSSGTVSGATYAAAVKGEEKPAKEGEEEAVKRRKLDCGGKVEGSGWYGEADEEEGGVILPPDLEKTETKMVEKENGKRTVSPAKRPAPVLKPIDAKSKTSQQKNSVKKPFQNPGAAPAVLVKKETENKKPISLNPRPLARPPAQHGVRYQLVMKLHEQLARLHNKPTTAEEKEAVIQKTLDIEEETAKTKATAYRSAMGHLILRLMKLTPAQYATEQKAKVAEDAKASASRGIEKPKANAVLNNYAPPVTTGLSSDSEIAEARKLIHTSSVLSKYEYTLHPPSAADIDKARKGLEAAGGYETCDRCSSRFCVFPGRRASDGALSTNGPCIYHSGRRFTSRPSFSSTWSCCDSTVGETPGCSTSPSHVFKVSDPKRLSVTFAYITTPSNPEADAEISKHGDRALALDAEMCYTTHGMEICRLSAVAFPSGEIVIDALVRPFGEVLDFNTRFSGVTAEMLSSAAPWSPKPYPPSSTPIINPTLPIASNPKLPILSSPLAARNALLKYITPETPLIGHSLGNDLDVLRLCHATVVDTMVLFPHVKGWPLRNRLKWCVERMLQREIQKEGETTGHDSVVDARCAGELVRWKVKDVLKKAKRAQAN